MRIRFLIQYLFMIILLSGCMRATSVSEIDSPVPSLSPLPTATAGPTELPSTALPSPIPSITPRVVSMIQQNCLQILPTLPNKNYSGKLVFKEDKVLTDKDYYYNISFLDLSTGRVSSLTSHNPPKISPDGKKYAVSFVDDPTVNIYSADGQLLNQIPPDTEEWTLDQWLNDTRLVFVYLPNLVIAGVTSYEYPTPLAIVDVLTGQHVRVESDYPLIEDMGFLRQWEGGDTTKYNSNLSRVVYRGANGSIRLWDVEHETLLAEIEAGDMSITPRWAPDGSQVAIRGIDGELYLVSRDGVIREYRLPPDPSQSGVEQWFSADFAWSPDGKQLAVWTRAGEEPSFSWTITVTDGKQQAVWSQTDGEEPFPLRSLMLLDVNSGTLTDLCISTRWGPDWNYITSFLPVWSPDGKYLSVPALVDGAPDTLLIDPEAGTAAIIANGLTPLGWLISEGK